MLEAFTEKRTADVAAQFVSAGNFFSTSRHVHLEPNPGQCAHRAPAAHRCTAQRIG